MKVDYPETRGMKPKYKFRAMKVGTTRIISIKEYASLREWASRKNKTADKRKFVARVVSPNKYRVWRVE